MTLSFNVVASNPCEGTGERFTFGEEPLTSKRYEAAKNINLGAWKEGESWKEHF